MILLAVLILMYTILLYNIPEGVKENYFINYYNTTLYEPF